MKRVIFLFTIWVLLSGEALPQGLTKTIKIRIVIPQILTLSKNTNASQFSKDSVDLQTERLTTSKGTIIRKTLTTK